MAAGPRTPPDRKYVKREIYVEFIVQGAYVKATAIDGATGLEASVVGLATAARAALSAAAVRKLDYVRKQRGET
jgi:hypothetical protein